MKRLPNYHILDETITEKDVDKWKRDSAMWMKNIRRVNNWKDYKQMVIGSRVWGNELEAWFDEDLLGNRRGGRESDKLGNKVQSIKIIRQKVWNFCMFVTNNFMNQTSPSAPDYIPLSTFLMNHGLAYNDYSLDRYTVEMWEELYQMFDKTRSYVYAKYQRLAKEAFSAMEQFFRELKAVGVDEVPSYGLANYTKILGVHVKMVDSEAYPVSQLNQVVIPRLTRGFKVLDKYGLLRCLNNITVVTDFGDDMSNGGHWDAYTKSIFVALDSFFDKSGDRTVYALYHEFGHMYYDFYMSKDQQELWHDFRTSVDTKLWFLNPDIQFWTALLTKMKFFDPDTSRSQKTKIIQELPLYVKDPVLKIKTLALVAGEFIDSSTTTLEPLFMTGVWSGVVTKYSLQKSGEAFPEVFANYLSGLPIPAPAEQVLRWVVPELK